MWSLFSCDLCAFLPKIFQICKSYKVLCELDLLLKIGTFVSTLYTSLICIVSTAIKSEVSYALVDRILASYQCNKVLNYSRKKAKQVMHMYIQCLQLTSAN